MDDENDLRNLRRAVVSSIPDNSERSSDVRLIQRKERKDAEISKYSQNSRTIKESGKTISKDAMISSDLRHRLSKGEETAKVNKLFKKNPHEIELSLASSKVEIDGKHKNEKQLVITVSNKDSRKIATYSDEERERIISDSYNTDESPLLEAKNKVTDADGSEMDSDYTIEVNSQDESDKDDSDSVYSIELKNIGGSESDHSELDQPEIEKELPSVDATQANDRRKVSNNDLDHSDNGNKRRTVTVMKLDKNEDLNNDRQLEKQSPTTKDITDKGESNIRKERIVDKVAQNPSIKISKGTKSAKSSEISITELGEHASKKSSDNSKPSVHGGLKKDHEGKTIKNSSGSKQHSIVDCNKTSFSMNSKRKETSENISSTKGFMQEGIINRKEKKQSEKSATKEHVSSEPVNEHKHLDKKEKSKDPKIEKDIHDASLKKEKAESTRLILPENEKNIKINKQLDKSIMQPKITKDTFEGKTGTKEDVAQADKSTKTKKKPVRGRKSVSSSSSCSTCSDSSSDSSASSSESDSDMNKSSSSESSSLSSASSSSSGPSDSDTDSSSSSGEDNFKRKKSNLSRDRIPSSSRRVQRSRSPVRDRNARYVSPLRTNRSEWGRPRSQRENENGKQRYRSRERARHRSIDKSRRRSNRRSREKSFERFQSSRSKGSMEYSRNDKSRPYRDRYKRDEDRKTNQMKQSFERDTERPKSNAEGYSQKAMRRSVDEKTRETTKAKDFHSKGNTDVKRRDNLNKETSYTKLENSPRPRHATTSKTELEKQKTKGTESKSSSSHLIKEQNRKRTENGTLDHERERRHARDAIDENVKREENGRIDSARKRKGTATSNEALGDKKLKLKVEQGSKQTEEKPRPLMEITLTGIKDSSRDYGRLSKRRVDIRDSLLDAKRLSPGERNDDSTERKFDRKRINEDTKSTSQVKKLSSGRTVLLDRIQIQPLMKPLDYDILKPVRVVERKDEAIESESTTKRIIMKSSAKDDSRSDMNLTSCNKTGSATQAKRKVFSRLGKQVVGKSKNISINLKDSSNTELKKENTEDKAAEQELDSRIKEIRERNEAILRRQREIEDDIKMHS